MRMLQTATFVTFSIAGLASARAEVPSFHATCPGHVEVRADKGGPVFLNGSAAQLNRFNASYFEARHGSLVVSISIGPHGSLSVSYTAEGRTHGICQIDASPRHGEPPEAGGPDFFRVRGVMPGDVLSVREAPTAASSVVGRLAPDQNGIRNLGCRGGMSFGEWQSASPQQRLNAERERWCRVEYLGLSGWAEGRFLGEGTAQ